MLSYVSIAHVVQECVQFGLSIKATPRKRSVHQRKRGRKRREERELMVGGKEGRKRWNKEEKRKERLFFESEFVMETVFLFCIICLNVFSV